FFFFSSIAVQTSGSGISILLTVAFIFRQWEVPSGSGNFLTNSGNALMPPKRISTSKAPAMTQAAIRQLVVDSVSTALQTQAAIMENADNANRNPEPREAPIARKCSYKEFMSCQPFNFKGSEGAIGLIRWFK
nr:reverse transcriptase domain-containing protein [Tanacetum cinerariifolium]